ncbi:MAG: hypothetical protein L3J87_05275 [Thermoplasmata archaeon]|nr:hypothetical protein [Thermoplasmata archaeon]
MKRTGRTIRSLVVAVAALMVTLVIPALALPASATTVAATGSANASTQWAYGTEKWVNVTITLPNATYSAQAFFGWHVVFTATNTSSSTFELEAQRAMLATYHASLCSPNCTSPTLQGNLSVKGWEKNAAFANLTTAAQVYENGTPAPALGIQNASSQSSGNLSEALSITATIGGTSRSSTANFDLAGHATSSIAFAPALGIVPWNLSSGLSWNSTSAFTAQGAWSVAYSWARTTFAGAHLNSSGNPTGTVNASGSVSIFGKDLGSITLNNGKTVPVIGLLVLGPFDDVDGVILVPHDFDFFGAMGHAYGHLALAGEAIATSKVDVFVDALHHRAVFEAAATTDGPQDASLRNAVGGSTASGPAAAPAGPAPSEFQAQPESVPTAQQASNCLVGSCPSTAASAASGWAFVLVIGLVIAAVLGTVSVVEYRTWRLRHGPLAAKPGTSGPLRDTTNNPPPGAYGPVPGAPTAPQPGEYPRPPMSP